MKDNPISARKRMKRWRRKNLKRHREVSADWKERNPNWYKEPRHVKRLTAALVRMNPKSNVWLRAGIPLDQWIDRAPCLRNGGLGFLIKGDRLEPIKPWEQCSGVFSLFLAPENFRLAKK